MLRSESRFERRGKFSCVWVLPNVSLSRLYESGQHCKSKMLERWHPSSM